jgi:hypothetical protein
MLQLMEVKLLSLELHSVFLKSETALRYVKCEFSVLFENCGSLIVVFELVLAYTFVKVAHLKCEFVVLFGRCVIV